MELTDYLNARIASLGDAYDRVCEQKTNLELDNEKLRDEVADLAHEVRMLEIKLKGAENRAKVFEKGYNEVSELVRKQIESKEQILKMLK